MNFVKGLLVFLGLMLLGLLSLAFNSGSGGAKLHAVPDVKVHGSAIFVNQVIKKNGRVVRENLGVPKVIFKQGGKLVHEARMQPG